MPKLNKLVMAEKTTASEHNEVTRKSHDARHAVLNGLGGFGYYDILNGLGGFGYYDILNGLGEFGYNDILNGLGTRKVMDLALNDILNGLGSPFRRQNSKLLDVDHVVHECLIRSRGT